MSDNQNAETRQRLKALCATTDGFKIAQEDLQLRGPGDFFGARQHGLPAFRIGNLATDMSVLKQAQEAAAQAIASKTLPEALLSQVHQLLQNGDLAMN